MFSIIQRHTEVGGNDMYCFLIVIDRFLLSFPEPPEKLLNFLQWMHPAAGKRIKLSSRVTIPTKPPTPVVRVRVPGAQPSVPSGVTIHVMDEPCDSASCAVCLLKLSPHPSPPGFLWFAPSRV